MLKTATICFLSQSSLARGRLLSDDHWEMAAVPKAALHELCPYFQFPAFINLHKLSHNIDDESGGEAEDSENGWGPPARS